MYKEYTLLGYGDEVTNKMNLMFRAAFRELGLHVPVPITKDNANRLVPQLFEEAFTEAGVPIPFVVRDVNEQTMPYIDRLFEQLFVEI